MASFRSNSLLFQYARRSTLLTHRQRPICNSRLFSTPTSPKSSIKSYRIDWKIPFSLLAGAFIVKSRVTVKEGCVGVIEESDNELKILPPGCYPELWIHSFSRYALNSKFYMAGFKFHHNGLTYSSRYKLEYHLDEEKIKVLHEFAGENYLNMLITPALQAELLRSIRRGVFQVNRPVNFDSASSEIARNITNELEKFGVTITKLKFYSIRQCQSDI